jgi:hypothetical protein
MTDFIFLSKGGEDEYINMLANSAGKEPTNTDFFDYKYDVLHDGMTPVLRGILKYKIMQKCLADNKDFYYVDSGYVGNNINKKNPMGNKLYHRIVKNDLQQNEIRPRPNDRWQALGINLQPRKFGKKIIIAAPDEKPCRYYGIDQDQWVQQTIEEIKKYTNRPIIVRQRAPKRVDRIATAPLQQVLAQDVHALVTFNSVAAVESILSGVPAFVLAPSHIAQPVASTQLSQIENPYWADQDKLNAWCHSMAYGQYHVRELRDGTAFRMMQEL